MRKKLLITGFEPFGGGSINPSWEAVSRLPATVGDFDVEKLLVPVEFSNGAKRIIEKAEEILPDVILCVGLAGGSSKVYFERIAVNIRSASSPDNAGFAPDDEFIVSGGREAYFSTVTCRKMADAVKEAGIPCAMSYSAGVYVCNEVLYTLLNRFDGTNTKVGFIHVPNLPEQAGEGKPSMSLENIMSALVRSIEVL